MSGHNKWSKIKHKKAKEDAKRSKVFAKFTALITMESRKASGDRSSPSLKAAIDRARAENMPSNNIERAIQKGLQSGAESLDSVLYEAYGPAGVAILIVSITDNKNRSAAEVRHILSSCGINMAEPGSAMWLFENKNGGFLPKSTVKINEEEKGSLTNIVDKLMELDDVQEVITTAE